MTPSGRVQSLIGFLDEARESEKPADGLLSSLFRARRYIGSKDRADIANRYFRVLRHQARYDWWIERLKLLDTSRSQVFLDCIFYGLEKGMGIDHYFDGSQYGPPEMMPREVKAYQKLKGKSVDHHEMPEAVRLECPDWAYDEMKKSLGDDFEQELTAMLEPASVHIRANELSIGREDVKRLLAKEGIETKEGELSPLSLVVEGRPALSQTKLFKKGLIEVQDEGSQLIALLCPVKEGNQVVDFCAGAGGKTLALGARMKNKGRIIACDVLAGKLKRSQKRFARAGLHNIEVRPLSSERDKWVKRAKGKFDVVLTDVPCSGTGTWKRNPDIRWRFLGPDLNELIELQRSILDSAHRLVKPGGYLVYGTCSLLKVENDDQINQFLKQHDDFELVPVADLWAEQIGTKNPGFKDFMDLRPHASNTDGFFAAVMRRKVTA